MKERETQGQEELKQCVCVRVSVMDLGYQTKKYCALQETRLTTIQSTADSSNNRTQLICVSEGERDRNTQD